MNTQTTTSALEQLKLPALQARFGEVVGEATRCPNRKYLIRKIEEALAARTSEVAAVATTNADAQEQGEIVSAQVVEEASPPVVEVASETPEVDAADATIATNETVGPNANLAIETPKIRKRGRFAGMTIEQLRALYSQTIGRPTQSSVRAYLEWKIREAEKGRVHVGEVRERATTEGRKIQVIPLRLDAELVERMDAAWKAQGYASRAEFLRKAIAVQVQQ